MNKLLLVFLLLSLNNICLGHVDRIIGGSRAKKHQFPFFAQLFMLARSNGKVLGPATCGATLIHPQWILSAAHCFINTTKAWVIVGTIKRNSSDGQKRIVTAIHKHPKFLLVGTPRDGVTKDRNDIAVAKLERKCKISRSVQLVHLPSRKISLCKAGMIVGIGLIQFHPKRVDPYVKYATVRSKSRQELGDATIIPYSKTLFFSEILMAQKKYAFKGDSGGPYLCYFDDVAVQFGITIQSANDTTRETVQTAYESVFKFMDFIEEYVPDILTYKGRKQRVGKLGKATDGTKSCGIVISSTSYVLLLLTIHFVKFQWEYGSISYMSV